MDKRRVSLVLVFVMIISVIRPYVWGKCVTKKDDGKGCDGRGVGWLCRYELV